MSCKSSYGSYVLGSSVVAVYECVELCVMVVYCVWCVVVGLMVWSGTWFDNSVVCMC